MRMGFVANSFFMHEGDYKYTKKQLIDIVNLKFDLDLSLIQYDNDIINFIEDNIEENEKIDYFESEEGEINVLIMYQTQLIISEKQCKEIQLARKIQKDEDGTYILTIKC